MLMNYLFPIKSPYRITQKFGENKLDYSQFGLKGHNGVDVAVPRGTPILCPFNGTIFELKDDTDAGGSGYGNYTRIRFVDSGRAYQWTFGHHLPNTGWKVGDDIYQGDVIAMVNSTGFSTGDHLHFGVREIDNSGNVLNYSNGYLGYIDPMPFFEEVPDEIYAVDEYYGQKPSLVRELYWKVIHQAYAKGRAKKEALPWNDRFMKAFVYGYWDANTVFDPAMLALWRNMSKPEYLKRLGRL